MSKHFNHDAQASDYDRHVTRESHPIRNGYSASLDRVVKYAALQPGEQAVDLGIGTGNLTLRMPTHAHIVGVDISTFMLEEARTKLGSDVHIDQQDILTWLEQRQEPLHAVVSSFAIHHLDAHQKDRALRRIVHLLQPGGRLAIADLGFADSTARAQHIQRWSDGPDPYRLRQDVEEEFFWDIAARCATLRDLGCTVTSEQVGPLIWCVLATV